MRDIAALLRGFGRLWASTWPALLLIISCGAIATEFLLSLAVMAGFRSGLAGFAVLSLVVLVKLIVVVLMLLALREHMPAVAAASQSRAGGPAQHGLALPGRSGVLGPLGVAVLPFFTYYAAWGFLGDTVREYSLLALASTPFGEKGVVLDVPDSLWLVITVLLSWALRRFAKTMRAMGARSVWQFVIVACDVNWIFVGLYVLSRWKAAFWKWLGTGGPLPYFRWLQDVGSWLIAQAHAASVAVELARPGFQDVLQSLFFYALLPLVWLLMVAVVYGYDIEGAQSLKLHPRAERLLGRLRALPKFLRDFVDHFVTGYRSRYLPILASIRLAFGAGLPTLLGLIVGYRVIEWLGGWAWIGLTRLIGPQDLVTWQAIASPISLLLGGPNDIKGGILIESLQLCLLAAVMERAVAIERGVWDRIRRPGENASTAAAQMGD